MSENIFTELYNRVLSLFGQTAPKEENAKEVACNRLRVVLMQDRTNLTPELLQRMRKELVELLSKYVEMDKEALELNFEQEGEQMALMLSIPVIRAKEESEIEEALKAEEEEKDAQEDSSDEDDLDSESSEDENPQEDEAAEENDIEAVTAENDENSQEDEETVSEEKDSEEKSE